MVAPLALAGIGAGVSIVSGLLGEWWASADEKERKRLEDKAAGMYGDISPAALEKVLHEELGPSALEGVAPDGQSREARRRALTQLMEMGEAGGMDEGSRLAVEQARRASAQQESSQRQAILAQAQRRGMGGSGLAMQAQLAAQQGAAERNSMAGMQGAADARQRALQAIMAGGDMAGGLERDDYDQKANLANARDRIAQFNNQGRADAARYRNDMAQRDYENRLGLVDRRVDGVYRQADAAGRRGDRKRRVASIGQDIGQFGMNWGLHGAFGGKKP